MLLWTHEKNTSMCNDWTNVYETKTSNEMNKKTNEWMNK